MSATTTANRAHTLARLVGVEADTFDGLDLLDLDVLYYGATSDGHSREITRVEYLDTAALELHADALHHGAADRAYCRWVLARRANAARRA